MSMRADRPAPDERSRPDPPGTLSRFLGGSPLGVIFRLALLSILVGVILEALGFDPLNILVSLRMVFRRVWELGFDAVRWLGRYLLLGAAVVVPIWLIMRLSRASRRW